MTKRIQSRLCLLAFLALTGCACYLWLTPSGGINRISVLRIKAGMSHEEVDAVIGLPYGYYGRTPDLRSLFGHRILRMYSYGKGEGRFWEGRFWYGNGGTILVWFDEAGKVTERHYSPSSPSLFDCAYRWVGVDAP